MKVTLEQSSGLSIVPDDKGVRKMQDFPQDRIRVDGMVAGYIGHHDTARACLIRSYSPQDTDEIERQIADIRGRGAVASIPAPNVPPELLQKDEDGIEDDDIDA